MQSLSLQFKLLLFALFAAASSTFTIVSSVKKFQPYVHWKGANYRTLHASTIALYSSLSNDEGSDELKEDSIPPSVASSDPASQPTAATTKSPPQLDPLFLAVTKMDPQTQRAERISVPIWGELILDRSLFVFLPIAIFALGGIFLSFYVLVNSSDTFVNAIIDTATKQSIPTSSSLLPDSESCRGLCSSQSQDLEGLRLYMNRLGGK